MRKPGLLCLVVLACFGLGACGSERGRAPAISTTAASPDGVKTFTEFGDDVSFTYPANWALVTRKTPGVATISSGGASATVWAYRAQGLVVTPEDQLAAQQRILASLKRRDPAFQLQSATLESRFGSPGVQVLGSTTISGHEVRIRSSHFWAGLGEYVIDQIADPAQYPVVNREVFEPMLAGIEFHGHPIAAAD